MWSSTSSAPRNFRLKLLSIIAVFALPLVGAYVSYLYWQPTTTINYGELLPVTQLPDTTLALADGNQFVLSVRRGKWLLLAVDSGTCESSCEKKLYTMRQVRLALGKHQDRVERAWLIDDGAAPEAAMREKYAGTWFVNAQDSGLLKHLKSETSPRDYLYLVDPLGNLMMRYPKEPDARRMLKDLNRLMQVSQIG